MASIEDIYNLVKEGEEKLELCKQAILFVGPTGTGKTSLVRHLCTDNTELYAKEYNGKVIIEGEGISNNLTRSQSIYPQLFKREDINCYDCPGFKDTRGASHEIAANYLLKKVVDQIEEVKIVVVCDFNLIFGGDRFVFMNLLADLTTFVKDVLKFKKSVFLVATAASEIGNYNTSTHSYTILTHQESVSRIAKALTKLREELNEQKGGATSYSPEVLETIKKLLYKLVKKSDGIYTQLSVFRVPVRLGALSEEEIMMEGRLKIIEMLRTPAYTKVALGDFSFMLSPCQVETVSNLAKRVDSDICSGLESVYEKIFNHFDKLTQDSQSFFKLHHELSIQTKILNKFNQYSSTTTDANKFHSALVNILSVLGIKEAIDVGFTLQTKFKYHDLLQRMLGQENVVVNSSWIDAITQWYEKCSYFKLWYDILLKIYKKASTHKIQEQKIAFQVGEVSKWGCGYKGMYAKSDITLVIDPSNVISFLAKLRGTFISVDQKYPPVEFMSVKRLDHLNDLLRLCFGKISNYNGKFIKFNNKSSWIADKKILTVTANFIRITDLDWLHNSKLKNEVNRVNLFAWDIIYIDIDLKPLEFDLFIIAPTVEIIKTSILDLKGKCLNNHAKADTDEFGNGLDGNKGSDGRGGRRFLCLTQHLNGKLSVNCSGGSGQDGQAGGDGADGCDGKDREFVQMNLQLPEGVENKDWFRLGEDEYRLPGEPGSGGGDAGRGGNGGNGGPCGLFFTNFPMNNLTQPARGGRGGLGGRPGIGGKNGCDRRIKITEQTSSDGTKSYEWWDKGLMKPLISRAENGDSTTDGWDGEVGARIEIDMKEFEEVIEDFKCHSNKPSKNFYLSRLLREFINNILISLELYSS